MVSTVSWTTFTIPSTLVNVGNEAVCMLCDNILCFSDLKTKNISYYKAENPQLGLSVSAMTGHNRFSLVAFSEVVLRPSVHIIQYPNFNKYAVFTTQNIIAFVDIRFSEYDLLLALSGQPNYTLCIWNFRTGQQLLQHDTLKASLPHSLLCSSHHTPQIVQFSYWKYELLVWELCYTATGVDLHEVSKIRLSKEFTLSTILSMCFGEDNNLYTVDNYGAVSMVEVAQFYLKPQWSIVDPNEIRPHFRYFKLESHRQGLIVYCSEIIYYIHKKQNRWYCEWKILNDQLPIGGLRKCVSNNNGEIYGSADIGGDLYHLDFEVDKVNVNPVNLQNENSLDFVVLKGIKEECLIQLTTKSCIKAIEMPRYLVYSTFEIPYANTIVAHNVAPYVMVGTTKGRLYFLNYSNIREPVELGFIETDRSYPIGCVKLMDHLAVYRSIYNHFYLVKTDFAKENFREISEIVRLNEKVGICQYFLAEDNYIFMFVNRDSEMLLPHTNELWAFQWLQEENHIKRQEYELPFTYRDVCSVTVSLKNIIEFYAVRLESNIIDCLQMKIDTDELVLLHRIQTAHMSNINGIVGSRNLLTWGVDGTYIHFRTHKKSPKTYGVCQILQIKYRPRVVQKVLDCFNGKYLVYMYSLGGIKVMKVATSGLPIYENHFITENNCSTFVVEPSNTSTIKIGPKYIEVVVEHSQKELQVRDKLLKRVQDLQTEVSELINYDMSVTGKSQGIFRKFCLNHKWLQKLTEESQKLCAVERRSLEDAISDQSRIRDWLYFLIVSTNSGITYKIRAIFSNFSLENYGLRKRKDKFAEIYDLYLFYDMEAEEENEEFEEDDIEQQASQQHVAIKKINYFKIQGSTAYEHIMSDALAMQDINIVSGNQMYNQDAKFRTLLSDHLKYEFNKKFEEIRQIKSELMAAILTTNDTLTRIYENMNCMLRLLGQPEFKSPQLSVPEWQKDEFVKSIMEVDDSEIKAINRHKKKEEVQAVKRGRLLLWSIDFWVRALITMMDGVLEKLWEEEIKKNIPEPEFLAKKEPAEYTLEDQKALKEYEQKCRILEADRKKYLNILTENEIKTKELKTNYILKLNENVTEMMILKLKYDFAVYHVRLRNLNTKMMYFSKLQWLNRIDYLRADIDLIQEYIQKYAKLSEFWSKSVDDLRLKVDALQVKEKSVERQFRSQFLNAIPQHLGPEMMKLFKKRPKTLPKLLNSTLICKELALRVNSRSHPKFSFPLPKEVYEYLETLNALDDPSNIPVSLESKHWDQFVRLRRQKVESELKIRAVNLQLNDSFSGMNSYIKDLANLKNTKADAVHNLQEAHDEYLRSVQNQTLELRLTMGQVELNIKGSLDNLKTCVLMHEDDINDINALILKAGQKKLKAMQRVAFFRRQVTFKEWEHKVVSANIEYLKYLLYIIEKCKVSIEFLNILRNWKKVKAEKQKMLNTEGILEKVSEEKLISFKKEIIRLNEKIAKVRQKTDEMKKSNKRINRQIENLKVSVAFATTNRDFMIEDKKRREQNERMEKIKKHTNLLETVRRDYVQIMELKTILELQRLRTYPTLGPNPSQCLF